MVAISEAAGKRRANGRVGAETGANQAGDRVGVWNLPGLGAARPRAGAAGHEARTVGLADRASDQVAGRFMAPSCRCADSYS